LQVTTVESGNDALTLLAKGGTDVGSRPVVDVVLKAHNPPHANAVRFLQKVRQIKGPEELPVIGTRVSALIWIFFACSFQLNYCNNELAFDVL
jgi:hypothetical protein